VLFFGLFLLFFGVFFRCPPSSLETFLPTPNRDKSDEFALIGIYTFIIL